MIRLSEDRLVLDCLRRQLGFRELAGFLLLIFCLLAAAPSSKAYCRSGDLIRQSTQEPGAAGNEKDIRSLEPGKPIDRELVGGQRHSYQVRLNADQFLKVIVEQQGIDVVVQASGPDGKQVAEFDSESRPRGEETIWLAAETAGDYRIVVRTRLQAAPAGHYGIRVEELRAAIETDRALQEARRLSDEYLKLQQAGKYDESLLSAAHALEIREKILGPDHPDVAAALDGMGLIYRYKGDYAKAEPLYKRALAIREKALGPEHPETARSLNNLANICQDKGDYADASPLFKRALEIREKTLGANHPDTALSLNDLAGLYLSQGKYAEAEPLFKRALEIRERALGKDHSDVAVSLNGLAGLYKLLGRYAEAEPLYRRALDICEKTLGADHSDDASLINIQAFRYQLMDRRSESVPLF
jgi:tetratricopeptide (TPR) repeat protein